MAGRPVAVDAQRTTAWLRREIVFDHEPLERVAAEYNRYSAKPSRSRPGAADAARSVAFSPQRSRGVHRFPAQPQGRTGRGDSDTSSRVARLAAARPTPQSAACVMLQGRARIDA